MDEEIVISVSDVHKSFKLPHEKYTGLKQALINFRFGKKYETQRVLNDVSFDIKKGEFFGIVGRNGSGKSTLLKLLAQIYTPDKGGIQVKGSLTPFIELGVGFNPELTGRENIYLNGALLGFNRKQMEELYDGIVEFAELGEFMDQKLKNYSSGMQVRLAFSIAIRAQSDILLVDEVLAVGDAAFQKKCFDYFFELKKKGTTVVFVSHDLSSLERFCDRGILIDKGRLVRGGDIVDVLGSYNEVVLRELEKASGKAIKESGMSPKNQYAVIKNASVKSGDKVSQKFTFGHSLEAQFEVEIKQDLIDPIFGITVWRKNTDQAVFAINTLIGGEKNTGTYKKGEAVKVSVKLPRDLNDGEYSIEPAIANSTATVYYDRKVNAASYVVSGSGNPISVVHTLEKIRITRK
jgi:ABC-2 type transport system ATP-binding protein